VGAGKVSTILWAWPFSGPWVLDLIIGANLTTSGTAVAMLAIAGKG
jgi:uncharacterized membrane protein HdeD (DUF308 family)